MIIIGLRTAILGLYLGLVFIFKVLPRWLVSSSSESGSRLSGQKPQLLYVSFIEWHGAYQRPHHLVNHLSKHYDILYVSLCRLHHWARRAEWWKVKKQTYITLNNSFRVLTSLAFPLDARFSCLRKWNNMVIFSNLKAYNIGTNWDLVLVNAPYYNELIKRLNYQRLIYDVMDELTEMSSSKGIKEAEAWLIKRAAVVTTGTYSLYLRKKEQHPRVQFILCGVDYDHFAQAAGEDLATPGDIANLDHPLFGYFGAINERLDFNLLKELASSITKGSIVLIGPIYRGKKELERFNNIHLLGQRPYKSLPAYLKAFDVALVPYRLTKGVQYVNPVKVLEYMAGGKPVLSTAIDDIKRFYSQSVIIAETHQEFIQLAQKIVAGSMDYQQRIEMGKTLAQQRSWAQMSDEFYTLLSQ